MTTTKEKIADKLLLRHATEFEFIGEEGTTYQVNLKFPGIENWGVSMRLDGEELQLLCSSSRHNYCWATLDDMLAEPTELAQENYNDLYVAVAVALELADGDRGYPEWCS